jgi:hypothetical protein
VLGGALYRRWSSQKGWLSYPLQIGYFSPTRGQKRTKQPSSFRGNSLVCKVSESFQTFPHSRTGKHACQSVLREPGVLSACACVPTCACACGHTHGASIMSLQDYRGLSIVVGQKYPRCSTPGKARFEVKVGGEGGRHLQYKRESSGFIPGGGETFPTPRKAGFAVRF